MAEDIDEHSKLSPSASWRWMHCAGSVEVNAGGGTSNTYAEEGTAAHHLLEISLRLDAEPLDFLGTHIYKSYVVTEEMAEAVGQAMDFVRSYLVANPKATLHIEKKVDPAALLDCAPDLTSGTLDIALDNAPVELVMIDYKHGVNVGVDVVDNTQLLQYAVGYIAQYATRPYERYRIVVIQPRHRHEDGPVRDVVLAHADVLAYVKKVKARLKEMRKKPDERVAGEWCRFCKGAGRCKTLAQASMQAAAMEFGDKTMAAKPVSPDELDNEELAVALIAWDTYIESWGKALYKAALELLMRGESLPHHKLVLGRTQRRWLDEKKVARMLLNKFNFTKDQIAPRSVVGIGAVEALFRGRIKIRGRKKNPLPPVLLPLITKNLPAHHVAHETDEREAVVRGGEFANVALPTAPKAQAKAKKKRK